MKPKQTLLFFAGTLTCLALTSFLIRDNSSKEKTNISISPEKNVLSSEKISPTDETSNYEKVYSFIESNVVTPIENAEAKKNSSGKNKVDYFSRCPSGIEPTISSDSVKVDKYVYGKVNNWRGCKALGLCVFRVMVSKKIAQVRDLNSKDFISVNDWIGKKYPKEVKG